MGLVGLVGLVGVVRVVARVVRVRRGRGVRAVVGRGLHRVLRVVRGGVRGVQLRARAVAARRHGAGAARARPAAAPAPAVLRGLHHVYGIRDNKIVRKRRQAEQLTSITCLPKRRDGFYNITDGLPVW